MDIFSISTSDANSNLQSDIIDDSLSDEIITQNTYYIDSTNHTILLSSYYELYNYIKNNTTYDGIYYYFYIDKQKHKITFIMRSCDLLIDTICKYYVIINIRT